MGDFYDEQFMKDFFPSTTKPANKMCMNMDKESMKNIDEQEEAMKAYFGGLGYKETKDAINPKHYQDVAGGLQYIELCVDLLADKKGIEAHLFGQIYKYLFRAGRKDPLLQDIKKAQWYLNSLVNYVENGEVLP